MTRFSAGDVAVSKFSMYGIGLLAGDAVCVDRVAEGQGAPNWLHVLVIRTGGTHRVHNSWLEPLPETTT